MAYGDNARYVPQLSKLLGANPGSTVIELAKLTHRDPAFTQCPGGGLVETYIREYFLRPGVCMGLILEGPRKRRRKTYSMIELPELPEGWYWENSCKQLIAVTDHWTKNGRRIRGQYKDGVFKTSVHGEPTEARRLAKTFGLSVEIQDPGWGQPSRLSWCTFSGEPEIVAKTAVDLTFYRAKD